MDHKSLIEILLGATGFAMAFDNKASWSILRTVQLYNEGDEFIFMSYGWAAIFTVGAWLVGGFLDGLLGSDTLGLNALFAIIAMGCCVMKFIKDNDTQ